VDGASTAGMRHISEHLPGMAKRLRLRYTENIKA
jgi:hypothetical protein